MLVTLFLILCSASAFAQHPGAYSSPQYAKKMYPKQSFDNNALLPRKEVRTPFKDYNSIDRFDSNRNATDYRSPSVLDSVGSFMSSAGGRVVADMAKDYIERSTSSSQVGLDCFTKVLSLNLTNLVILVVLKALILAAGFFGAGAWKGGHHYGRSLEDNSNTLYISEDEVLLYLGYLAGQQTQDYGCLYRLSCQRPKQAALYSSGADLLLQGTKMFTNGEVNVDNYDTITSGIKEAVAWGQKGMSCEKRYSCGE